MGKKHFWVSSTAMRKLTGIRATCLDCRESRTGDLRGGACPGRPVERKSKRGGR